jgi:hypothetical protein
MEPPHFGILLYCIPGNGYPCSLFHFNLWQKTSALLTRTVL